MDGSLSYDDAAGDARRSSEGRTAPTFAIVPANESRELVDEGISPAAKRTTAPAKIQLKRLSPRHRQALALLSQGLSRADTAEAVGYRPEYISWLLRQEVAQVYIREMNEASNAQLTSMFSQSVDSIGRALQNGSIDQQLAAAKLQMRATGKLDPEKEDRRSAEDVVAALLQVNINISR